MSFIQRLLLHTNSFFLAFVAVGVSIAVASLTTLATGYVISYERRKENNTSKIILFGASALVYAVLLTVVLLSAWFGFQNAQSNAQKEANCLVELYRDTEAFLPEIKEEIHSLLREYTKSILGEEWHALAKSELNPATTEIAKKIWKVSSTLSPKTETEQVFLHESVRKLYELREYRTQRLFDSKTGVYGVIWFLLILGEVATVFSIAVFAEDLRSSFAITCLFGFLVGIIFYAIVLFDYPYTGQFRVYPDAFKQVLLSW